MKKIRLPQIGQRIIKSAVGVLICYIVYLIRGKTGAPFYSMLAVLWCIQPYTDKTYKMAVQRITGTLIGAVFGLAAILIETGISGIYNRLPGYFLNAFFIIPVIYTTVLLHKQNASYFSCVVYLSITVNHIADADPYIFVFNRVLDTFIGIAAGIIVNYSRMPRKKVRDSLFVAKLDDMLTPVKEELSPYSKVELNRMIADGMNFTIFTMRTPASLIKPLDGVNLKLPVIVMDGAALYDLKENSYLKTYIISDESSRELVDLIRSAGMNCFINSICDDTLMIFYKELINEAESDIFNKLKRSPYRNYINSEPADNSKTIYIMLIDRTDKVNDFYKDIIEKGFESKFKILCYSSDNYKGYSYIKIYNKNAECVNMIKYLMDYRSAEKIVSIGTGEGNDISAGSSGLDSIVKTLKKTYEPMIFTGK